MLFDIIIFIQLSVILFFSLSTYSILYSTFLSNDEDKKSFYLVLLSTTDITLSITKPIKFLWLEK